MGDSAKLVAYRTVGGAEGRPITVSKSKRGEMEAYRIDRFGSVDGIVLRSSEDPRPDHREVLMRVRASSLNYRDLMVLKGGGRGPTKLGVVPLSDGAGEVAAIGDGVTRVNLGDRIIGTFPNRLRRGRYSLVPTTSQQTLTPPGCDIPPVAPAEMARAVLKAFSKAD